MSKKVKPVTAVIPVRLPDDLQTRIRELSKKSRLSDQDVMRMALDRGLSAVEKMFEPAEQAA